MTAGPAPHDAPALAGASGFPAPEPGEVGALVAARATVLGRIADACALARRDPAGVTLVAVCKTVPPGRIRAAVAAGLHVLGENRVQEAAAKVPLVPGACWHLVGPLQANKARRATELFDVVETVDSLDLARRLDRIAADVQAGRRLAVLLEVNVDLDPAKAGFAPADVDAALDDLAGLPNLELRGLMTIGRLSATPAEARGTFRALRVLSERLRPRHAVLGPDLSMGMSDDYPVAVEEGATIVRVGRALFGERSGRGPATGR